MLYTGALTIQITMHLAIFFFTFRYHSRLLGNPVNLAKMSLFAFITPVFQLYNSSVCTVIDISPSKTANRKGLVTGSVLGT